MKRTITTLAATLFASLAIAIGAGNAIAADPCTMPIAGGTAPCPPPIVSTSGGDSIGGDANTDPVNMRDLRDPNAPESEYVAPSWTPDEDADETETPDDGAETPADSGE